MPTFTGRWFVWQAMSRFISQALTGVPITVYGDGQQTRSFCYVTDNVTGLLLLQHAKKPKESRQCWEYSRK